MLVTAICTRAVFGSLCTEGRRRHEQHRITSEDRLAADRYGQVCLADTGRAQQHHRLGIGDEPPGRDLADLLLVERGLGGKVGADCCDCPAQ